MMIFGMSDDQYEIAGLNILYGKLIGKLIEDFVTREDAKLMMKSSNLPVNTQVKTIVNTAVQVAIPAGTGTGVGAGQGTGNGTASPIYTGDKASPGSEIIRLKRQREKLTGQTEAEGSLEAISTAAGGTI